MFAKHRTVGFVALACLSAGCTQVLDFESTTKGVRNCDLLGANATFCDDFDHRHLLARWKDVEQENGTAVVDETASRSIPGSLLATSEPLIAHSGSVRAVANRSFSEFANTPISVRATFDMMVERIDPNLGAQMAALTILYGPLDNPNEIFLHLNSTGNELTWQVTEKAHEVSVSQALGPFDDPLLGAWTTMEIELTIREPLGTGNTLSARLNGEERLVERALQIPLRGEFPSVELGIGWVYTDQDTESWSVRYDNFVLDITPLET